MTDIPNTTPGGDASLAGEQTRLIADSVRVNQTIGAIRTGIGHLTADVKALVGVVHDLDAATAKASGGRGATVPDQSKRTARQPEFKNTSQGQPGTAPDGGGGTAATRHELGGGAGLQSGGAFAGMRAFANRISQQTGGRITGPQLIGASLAGVAGAQVVGSIDQRVARGREYASGADKLSVLMQQITGMSQMNVINNMRRPLTNYRLGPGGINEMLQFQAQTGYAATPQMASSIAGISAATGYSKSTADILADQRAMLNPQVANRMFTQLGGVNAYTFGGRMRDPMQLRQQMVQSLGLTNSTILRGAAGPGSITRARMTQAGVPEEMQDELINYAQSNQQFQRRGGKGMYDPSKPADRKLMGIEGNLATQEQETDRLRVGREEQFMKRQIDNMTTSERQTQTMIKLLGGIEDKISAVIGARAGTSGWQRMLGRGMQLAGVGLLASGVGAGFGVAAIAGGTALAGSGDPVGAQGPGTPTLVGKSDSTQDASISIPAGYNGGRMSLNALKGRADFKKMNPKMQDRLLNMFRANPNVGLGQGFRDTSQQKQMFMSRYRRTSKQTKIFYDGSYWEHTSGAPAAPPGSSMHEIGMAADLIGDMSWMNANASKFGLKHFAGVNGEPWHVQPSDVPNSRSEYEHGTGMPSTPAAAGTTPNTRVVGDDPGGGGATGPGMSDYAGLSISQIIQAAHADNVGRLGGGGRRSAGSTTKTTSGTPLAISAVGFSKGSRLSGADVARAAYAAGFRGDALIRFVGIAMRESGGNSGATNMTGPDNSYGLWQINMKGALGPARLKQYGLKSNEDLYDPNINARVAFQMSGGGSNMSPWTIKGNPLARVDMTAAAQYVKDAGKTGDPMPLGGGSGRGGNLSISSAPQITVAPTINFHGIPQSQDLRRIATEVGALLKQEVHTLEMRNA